MSVMTSSQKYSLLNAYRQQESDNKGVLYREGQRTVGERGERTGELHDPALVSNQVSSPLPTWHGNSYWRKMEDLSSLTLLSFYSIHYAFIYSLSYSLYARVGKVVFSELTFYFFLSSVSSPHLYCSSLCLLNYQWVFAFHFSSLQVFNCVYYIYTFFSNFLSNFCWGETKLFYAQKVSGSDAYVFSNPKFMFITVNNYTWFLCFLLFSFLAPCERFTTDRETFSEPKMHEVHGLVVCL